MQTPDLVIRGGTVVDGSGAPPFEADVVVEGDRVVAVGKHDGAAGEVIDAKGKIVTPGFVDVHTHLDAQITWDPLGSPSNLHGVTSVIVGNCGVGFAPCKPRDRDYLMFLMEGVEDIPQAALNAGLRWNWETFPEYLDALARQPLGLNVGAHLSHAPLRIYVMGERGATDTPATDDGAAADAATRTRCDASRRARLRHRTHDDAPHAGVGSGAGHVRRPARAHRHRQRAGAVGDGRVRAGSVRRRRRGRTRLREGVRLDGAGGARQRPADQSVADPEPRLPRRLARGHRSRRRGQRARGAHRAAGRGAQRRHPAGLRHLAVAAVAVPSRRRPDRQAGRRAARAAARSRRARPAERQHCRDDRRHPRRHGAPRERLPARRHRRAHLRDRRPTAASSPSASGWASTPCR